MPGDTTPTVYVNLVYTPVAPALPFQPNTFYPAGSIVLSTVGSGTAATTNGHYYVAVNSGIASSSIPDFNAGLVPVQTFPDGTGISWKDVGTSLPSPAPPACQANTAYAVGAHVVTPAPANGHYYEAQSAGITGPTAPPFPVGGTIVSESTGIV